MAATSKGLCFARGILEKYGWEEGKGLGRNENGLVEALKPKLKFDTVGFGHSGISEHFTSYWWEQAYNKVAEGITVEKNNEDIQVKQGRKEEVFKTKDSCPISMYSGTDYNSFVKTTILTNEGMKPIADSPSCPDTVSEDDSAIGHVSHLSDEEIFRACGGRTVHKGARHGLKLNGKLARIQRQEEALSLKYQTHQDNSKISNGLETFGTSKTRKKRITVNNLEGTTYEMPAECSHSDKTMKKKMKKKHISNNSEDFESSQFSTKKKKRNKLIETDSLKISSTAERNQNSASLSLPHTTYTYDVHCAIKKKKKERESKSEVSFESTMISPVIFETNKKRKKRRKLQEEM